MALYAAVEFANLKAEGAAALKARLVSAATDVDPECSACAERLWAAVRPLGSVHGGNDDAACKRLVESGAVKRVKKRAMMRIGTAVLWRSPLFGDNVWVPSVVIAGDPSSSYNRRMLLPDCDISPPLNVNPGQGQAFVAIKDPDRTFAPSQELSADRIIALVTACPAAARVVGERGDDAPPLALLGLARRALARPIADRALAAIVEASFPAKRRALTAEYVVLIREVPTEARLSAFIEGGADPERLLLATALLESIPLASFLLSSGAARRGTERVAGDGRIASVVGAHSSSTDVVDFFHKFGSFLNRYVVQPGVVHRSKTCMVCVATDVAARDRVPCVALKLMRCRDEFEREVRMREQIAHGAIVIAVLGWHTPRGEVLNGTVLGGGNGQRDAPTGGVDVAAAAAAAAAAARGGSARSADSFSAFPYVLVLERGGQSIFYEALTQRVAGIDADAVVELFRAIASR